MAVGTSTNPSASGVFAFSSWPTGATNGDDVNFSGSVDPNKYYQVTVTPSGSLVTLNSIAFNMSRSSTGPRHWVVRSSQDGYATNLPASISPANSNISVQTGDKFFWAMDSYTVSGGKQERGSYVTLGGASFSNQTNPITFRFYAYDAEGNAGTFRIDTVIFNGMTGGPAGIAEFTQNINSVIKIYPNPSNDGIIYLDPKKIVYSKVEVVNILGSVVAEEHKETATNEKLKLNLNTLPSGTYFVRVTAGNKVYTERFFISK
jgi:hypothetical protein